MHEITGNRRSSGIRAQLWCPLGISANDWHAGVSSLEEIPAGQFQKAWAKTRSTIERRWPIGS